MHKYWESSTQGVLPEHPGSRARKGRRESERQQSCGCDLRKLLQRTTDARCMVVKENAHERQRRARTELKVASFQACRQKGVWSSQKSVSNIPPHTTGAQGLMSFTWERRKEEDTHILMTSLFQDEKKPLQNSTLISTQDSYPRKKTL